MKDELKEVSHLIGKGGGLLESTFRFLSRIHVIYEVDCIKI